MPLQDTNNSADFHDINVTNENILENDLKVLCLKNNKEKIKTLLDDLCILNVKLSKNLEYFFKNINNIPEDMYNEIHNVLEKHHSLFNIIYYNLFREKPNFPPTVENANVSYDNLVQKLLAFSNILERLADVLDCDSYSKYLIEMLIDTNKILCLMSIYKGNSNHD